MSPTKTPAACLKMSCGTHLISLHREAVEEDPLVGVEGQGEGEGAGELGYREVPHQPAQPAGQHAGPPLLQTYSHRHVPAAPAEYVWKDFI